MSSEMKLRHVFPEIGEVIVPLYGESSRLFRAIERQPTSGTAHLEKLPHLGELSAALHCGHHSRYEYLVFQLHLIHFLKEHAKAFGLATSVDLSPGICISSAEELLKCWAIICENGHLFGTYESERCWLEQFCTRPQFRQCLIDLVESRDVQRIAERILDEEDIFSLYRVFAWIFLQRAERLSTDPTATATFSIAKSMLLALLRDPTPGTKLERCQHTFKRIRRFAYLYLDLARLPAQLRFNPSIVMQDLRRRPSLYLESSDSRLHNLIDALHEMALEQVYASPDATRYKLERSLIMGEAVEARVARRGLSYFVRPTQNLEQRLQAAKGQPLTERRGRQDRWQRYVRLYFPPREYFSPEPCKIVTEARSLQTTTGSAHWAFFLTPYTTEGGSGHILDVFEERSTPEEREGQAIRAIIGHIRHSYREWDDIPEVFDWILEEGLLRVFETVLKRFVRQGLQVRTLRTTKQFEYLVSLLPNKQARTKWSRSVAWQLRREKAPRDRRWESDCLRPEVRGAQRGLLLVANCNIALEDDSNRRIAEIDGAFIRILRGSVDLALVEAKSGRRAGSGQAIRQLTETLIDMGATDDQAAQLVQGRRKYALATIPLSIGRRWATEAEPWKTGD
jgi:hypothetical protein